MKLINKMIGWFKYKKEDTRDEDYKKLCSRIDTGNQKLADHFKIPIEQWRKLTIQEVMLMLIEDIEEKYELKNGQ